MAHAARVISTIPTTPATATTPTTGTFWSIFLRTFFGMTFFRDDIDIFLKCLKLCCISPSSSLIHRSVFDDFGYFDENLLACEDYDFWLRFCAYEKVHYLDETLLIKYGGHEGQLSHTYWGMDRFRICALEKLLLDQSLSSFKRQETLKEIIFRLEILINGSLKRNKGLFAHRMIYKKSHWEPSKKTIKGFEPAGGCGTLKYCIAPIAIAKAIAILHQSGPTK